MLPGQLVLRAVGPLQGLHPHARRGYDAQGEHQQPKDLGGPRVGCSDHDAGTIGAPTLMRNRTLLPPRSWWSIQSGLSCGKGGGT